MLTITLWCEGKQFSLIIIILLLWSKPSILPSLTLLWFLLENSPKKWQFSLKLRFWAEMNVLDKFPISVWFWPSKKTFHRFCSSLILEICLKHSFRPKNATFGENCYLALSWAVVKKTPQKGFHSVKIGCIGFKGFWVNVSIETWLEVIGFFSYQALQHKQYSKNKFHFLFLQSTKIPRFQFLDLSWKSTFHHIIT